MVKGEQKITKGHLFENKETMEKYNRKMKKTKNKDYITQDDFTEEEKASAKKKCDEISKEYGLDKIDKRITASTDLKEIIPNTLLLELQRIREDF